MSSFVKDPRIPFSVLCSVMGECDTRRLGKELPLDTCPDPVVVWIETFWEKRGGKNKSRRVLLKESFYDSALLRLRTSQY